MLASEFPAPNEQLLRETPHHCKRFVIDSLSNFHTKLYMASKQSALQRKLTEEQFNNLKTFAIDRRKSLISDLNAFRCKREKFELVLNDDFENRKTTNQKNTTIFDLCNETLNITRSTHRFMKGRMAEDIFGSEPYFSAVPQSQKTTDPALSDQIQKYGGFKIREAEFARYGKEAIGLVLQNGECAVKTTWETDIQPFERYAVILHDELGQPVLTSDGENIYDDDETEDVEEPGEEDSEGATTKTVRKYTKDPNISLKEGYEFKEQLIKDTVVRYRGLTYTNIDFRNFYFPINTPDIERTADMIGHDYDSPYLSLRAKYREYLSDDEWNQIGIASPAPKSEGDKPRVANDEQGVSNVAEKNPPIKTAELYFKFDCFEDGVARDIYMVLAVDDDQVLYCDYLANITPNGVRPITMLTVNRVPGRCYGRGYVECYEMAQRAIDKLLNSIIYRNEMNADPVIAIKPDSFNETVGGKNWKRGPGKMLTFTNQGMTLQDAIQILDIPDLDERTVWLIELFMQWIQNDSGVTAAAQGDVGSLPQNATATGTNAILESGSILHRLTVNELKEGFEKWISYSMSLLFWKQDESETYAYLEGDGQLVMALKDIRQLKNLPINVQLIMTRLKMREQREAAVQAIPVAQGFALLPPYWQERFKQFYVQAFKGFGFDNVDDAFQPPPPQPGIDPVTGQPIAPMMPAEQVPMEGDTGQVPAAPMPINVLPAPQRGAA